MACSYWYCYVVFTISSSYPTRLTSQVGAPDMVPSDAVFGDLMMCIIHEAESEVFACGTPLHTPAATCPVPTTPPVATPGSVTAATQPHDITADASVMSTPSPVQPQCTSPVDVPGHTIIGTPASSTVARDNVPHGHTATVTTCEPVPSSPAACPSSTHQHCDVPRPLHAPAISSPEPPMAHQPPPAANVSTKLVLDPSSPSLCYATTRDWTLAPLSGAAVQHLGKSLARLSGKHGFMVATACSGTDVAMSVLDDCARGWPAFRPHQVFACEKHPDKQGFLRDQCPKLTTMFNDVVHIGDPQAHR